MLANETAGTAFASFAFTGRGGYQRLEQVEIKS
jgi:hypothetical protein